MKFTLFTKIRAALKSKKTRTRSPRSQTVSEDRTEEHATLTPERIKTRRTPPQTVPEDRTEEYATLTPERTKKRRPRPQTIYQDRTEEYANDGRDHTRDDNMGAFEYYHRKVTGWNTDKDYEGKDGIRDTRAWTNEYKRREESYRRRRSERRAAKEAARAAKEAQEDAHTRWSNPNAIDPKPKRKMVDLLPDRKSQAVPLQEQVYDSMSYPPEKEELDLG